MVNKSYVCIVIFRCLLYIFQPFSEPPSHPKIWFPDSEILPLIWTTIALNRRRRTINFHTCQSDQTLRGNQWPTLKSVLKSEPKFHCVCNIPSWFFLSSIRSHYDWRINREALAGDEVMVQGIDYTSVSPIFSFFYCSLGSLVWCTSYQFLSFDLVSSISYWNIA